MAAWKDDVLLQLLIVKSMMRQLMEQVGVRPTVDVSQLSQEAAIVHLQDPPLGWIVIPANLPLGITPLHELIPVARPATTQEIQRALILSKQMRAQPMLQQPATPPPQAPAAPPPQQAAPPPQQAAPPPQQAAPPPAAPPAPEPPPKPVLVPPLSNGEVLPKEGTNN